MKLTLKTRISILIFACILNPIVANGDDNCIVLPLRFTLNQKNILKAKFDTGQLVSAIYFESSIWRRFRTFIWWDSSGIPSTNIDTFSFGTRDNNNGRNLFFGKNQIEGYKNVLVVKVKDTQRNRALQDTTDQISDDAFGTNGDPLNLKSQTNACFPGEAGVHTKSPGVIEVQTNIRWISKCKSASKQCPVRL